VPGSWFTVVDSIQGVFKRPYIPLPMSNPNAHCAQDGSLQAMDMFLCAQGCDWAMEDRQVGMCRAKNGV
jgi:hypothetical protein